MIITATQIKIKSIWGLFCFVPRVKNIRTQLSKTDGLLFQKYKGVRTLTAWESHVAMKAFRNSGHHLDAMKNLKSIGKAKSITWETESEPSCGEAIERLRKVKF